MGSDEQTSTRVPFVGRAEALADIRAALDRAQTGRGAVVVVRGEAGVGKTHLVEHALDERGDALVLWARCRADGAPPLWPWQQLARAARRHGVAQFEALFEVLPGETGDGRSGHDRFARFDRVADELLSVAASGAMVLVIDDAQWADEDSLVLLTFLAADISRTKLCVIATERTGESDDPALNRIANDPAVTTIELSGLRDDELRSLLDAVLGLEPDDGVVVAVAAHTGGNPFFVRESARLLRASGRAGDPSAWRGLLPAGVRTVLGRRFARLPTDSHRALGAAAVAGAEFDVALVGTLLERDRTTVHEDLDAAAAAGLLLELPDGRLRFTHSLVRDAALVELTGSVRRDLHRRAATELIERGEPAPAVEIAEHSLAAGDIETAQRWFVTAARRATTIAMHADAARFLRRALDLPVDPGDQERATMLVEFAAAAGRCGRSADATSALDDAVRLARAADLNDVLAKAALAVGTLGGAFEIKLLNTQHQALLEEALQRTPPHDSSLRSWLLARLSVAGSLSVNDRRRRDLADEAVEVARRVGDDAALAHALAAFCDSRAGPAFIAERVIATEAMLAAAARCGDPELELLALRMRIVVMMEQGSVAAARRHITAFATLADRLRQPQFRWYARLMEGMLAHLAGDDAAALALCEEATAQGRAAASDNARMLADGALMPVVLHARGEREEARRWLRDAVGGYPEATRGIDPAPLVLFDDETDLGEARATVDGLVRNAAVEENDAIFLFMAATAARAAAAAGDRDLAMSFAERLLPYADLMVLDGWAAVCYGPVSLFLARTAELLGDGAEARSLYRRAVTAIAALGAPVLDAEVRSRLGALGSDAPSEDAAVFARSGELWDVSFGGASARFVDAKGMRDLAALLMSPGKEIHVLDLVGVDDTTIGRTAGLGPALDAAARRNYEARIVELTGDLVEAEDNNDFARAERIERERDQVLAELSRSLGLSGRSRAAGPDPAERARKAVGMRIRASIDKIDREMPDLGRHLRHSIRTGVFCAYEPERPVSWTT